MLKKVQNPFSMFNLVIDKIRSYPKLILFLFFTVIYFKVPFIFFQQDEWYGFGNMITYGENLLFHRFQEGDINHFVPINNLINFLFFNSFFLNNIAYNIFGLSIHFINALLVYKIGQKLFKDNFFAFISSLLFITISSASEIVMWPSISISILALTFSLLAFFLILKFINQKNNFSYSLISAILIISSLLTIEYSAGMLIFIPISLLVLNEGKGLKKIIIFLTPLAILSPFYLYFRFNPQSIVVGSVSLSKHLPLNLPLNYLGQLTVTEQVMNFIGLFTNPQPIFANENLIAQINLVIGVVIFIFLSTLITKSWKLKKEDSKILILAMLFLLSSSLPFIFTPSSFGVKMGFSLIPSRYFYFGLVGMSLLVPALIKVGLNYKNSLFVYIGVFSLFISIILGIGGNWYKQNDLYQRGNTREIILKKIKNEYPSLPEKVIFYTESDKSYYGLAEDRKILPFQSGFGQTLLVWYYQEALFPKEFYTDRFLWEMTSEGYKEINGRGFGYFRDLEMLKKTVKKYNIPSSSILAFSWVDNKGSLTDISEEIRKKINE